MQQPHAFEIDPNALETDPEPSDRFVYSLHYVPFDPKDPDTPKVLPPYRKAYLARLGAVLPEEERAEALNGYSDVLELATVLAAGAGTGTLPLAGDDAERLVEVMSDTGRDAARLRTLLTEETYLSDAVREEVVSGLDRIASTSSALTATTMPTTTTTTTDPSQVPGREQLAGAIQSEVGYLFLDRTRIRPSGFALGEHLLSLSLAPGEEVNLEQRAFSKREATFEELTDTEQTFDLELSSSVTNELSEGLDHELSTTRRDESTMGFHVSGGAYGVNVDMGPTSAQTIDEADRDTSRSSVKNSSTASSKVAARYRKQHKITFRVSTESRFESTSRRLFRNPNPYTPIDLHYFKVLQRLVLAQERYGVRLCWAPAVRDPGGNVEARLAALKAELEKQASTASAGPRPAKPTAPDAQAGPQPRLVSLSKLADKWDWAWGNQRYDYDIDIDAPSSYQWDGDQTAVGVTFTFSGTRPAGVNIVRSSAHLSGVKVIVHVGVENRVWWDAASLTYKSEPTGSLTFTVTARFVPIAGPTSADAAYQAQLEAWTKADAEWQARDAAIKADALVEATAKYQEARAAALAAVNPLHETLAVMIASMFPSQYRDDIWEIDFWERIFDWANAALRLYPSWWNDQPARDKNAGPIEFINASWARLFLPIRPGAEEQALGWIFALTTSGRLPPNVRKMIKRLVDELKAYRTKHFGDAGEVAIQPTAGQDCPVAPDKFICMARWQDVIPTDGTHLEVLQATTIAADDEQRVRIDDAAALRQRQLARLDKDNEIRDAAISGGLGSIDTDLRLNVGEDEPPA